MPAATTAAPIVLPKLDIEVVSIKLVGDSPLVTHKWSEKAKRQMLEKQTKKANKGREAKDPEQDYFDSIYWLNKEGDLVPEVKKGKHNGLRCGFPTIAFKAAAVTACTSVAGVTKVAARQAFHVEGEYAVIDGEPKMREDMVRVGMGTADIRYRGEFHPWSTRLNVRINPTVMSVEQVVNLFNLAGFAVGVGEARPEKDGAWGMFHVD